MFLVTFFLGFLMIVHNWYHFRCTTEINSLWMLWGISTQFPWTISVGVSVEGPLAGWNLSIPQPWVASEISSSPKPRGLLNSRSSGSRCGHVLQIPRTWELQAPICFLFRVKPLLSVWIPFFGQDFGMCCPRESWPECGGHCVFPVSQGPQPLLSIAQFSGRVALYNLFWLQLLIKGGCELNVSIIFKNTSYHNFYYKHMFSLIWINKENYKIGNKNYSQDIITNHVSIFLYVDFFSYSWYSTI